MLSNSKWLQYWALYLMLSERYNTIIDDVGVDTAGPWLVRIDFV